MSMEIKKDLATVRVPENSFGRKNNKKYLVIHQTGNPRKGADAQMHAKYQKGRIGEVSWHWQVDDNEAIQSFEHDVQCYHASDGLGDGNLNSIAIEGCINVDGDYKKSVDNMARLAAKILNDENISIMNMKQHYDFARDKKNCPQQIREGKEGIDWTAFVKLVQSYISEPIVAGAQVVAKEPVIVKPTVKPVVKEGGILNMSGTFVAREKILVRNKPSTSATHIATYYPGEQLKYDCAHFVNNYVWLEYRRGNGGKGYIPIAPLKEIWGQLK